MENLLVPYQASTHFPSKRALVFAPHPDDEVFGCGGAIMFHVERGIPVTVIIITDGAFDVKTEESADYILQRQQESITAAKILGYGSPQFWNYADRQVVYGEKFVQEILTAIQDSKADLIYAPSVFEMHPDHRAIGMAVVEAARRIGKDVQVALYEVGIPLHPNRLLDITNLVERKAAAMACFSSQNAKQRYDLHIAALNQYRAYTLPASITAAEAYILIDADELTRDPLKLYQSEYSRQKALGLTLDNQNLPLVSVIIRSMDRPTLSEALDSVALQTYANIEVVIVNAKGTNHRQVDEWCGRFPIRFIAGDGSLARSSAANLGLNSANGEYLIFLDDDDLFDPDHIANLVETLNNSKNCSVAYAGVRAEDRTGAVYGIFNFTFVAIRLMAGNFIPIHAVLFKRDLVMQGCQFDESLDCYEDWDFWLQASQQTSFVHTSKVTAVYRSDWGNSGMSRTLAPYLPLQRQYRLMVWEKWWRKWTIEDFDLLVTDFHQQINSQQHYSQQQLASITHTENELRAENERLKAEIISLNQVVSENNEHIMQLRSSIAEIFDSRSWKLTKPIRFFSRITRRILQNGKPTFSLALQYYHRHGSIYKVLQRIFNILRNEGLNGIKWRLIAFHKKHGAITELKAKPATKLRTKPASRLEKHGHLPLSTIDIAKYDFFFIDVFDTAIIRLLKKPVDLFEYISIKTQDSDFHLRRIQQETETRKQHKDRKEISIFEIYENLVGDSIEEEIAAELKFCIANPEVYDFYSKLLSAKKKIYFVSDMYLDKETISKILHASGFCTYEDIYVSSEDNLLKGDGSRFEWLKRNIPGCVGATIHIGDNRISDFSQPQVHGFDAFHYMESDTYYRQDSFLYSKMEFLSSQHSLGLSFLLATFRYWKLGFHDQSPNYWRQFGFLYGGALISAFCGFINKQLASQKLSCDKIYFLARDGDIMSQVYQLLYDDVQAVYLMASRRCMLFPSLQSLTLADDEEALPQFIGRLGNTSAKDILERFGYSDLDNLEADLNNIHPDPSKWTEQKILACILRHKQSIMEKVVAERSMLFDYLSEMSFFAQDDIVVVDVGWDGSIQDSLTKLLKLWNYPEKHLHGIYLGAKGRVSYNQTKTGFLFNGNQSQFFEYLNLIELITSSPQNGIVRIDRVDGNFVPVTGTISEHEKKRQLVSVEIQKGILDFAHLIKKRNIASLDLMHANDFKILFESLGDYASKEDVVQFERLKHAKMIGNRYTDPVIQLKTQHVHSIKLITVFITPEMYDRFFTSNAHVNYYELVGIDNRKLNRGLPTIYNEVIENHIHDDCWLFFVHEDFEIKCDLTVVDNLDRRNVYGTFGVKLEHDVPVGYGKHICSKKDGSSPIDTGNEVLDEVKIQSLDCQSILVHTSLLAKHPLLRFDENLTFDLYAEDFSINAQEKYGIDVKVFPLKFQHYSHGNVTERYHAGLRYLAIKYPSVGIAGPCSFIGGRTNELEKKYTYDIPANPNTNK